MIAFCGYGFCGDGNSLHPTPTNVENIISTEASNAIFDNLEISTDVTSAYTTDKMTEWGLDTVIWADFEGNLAGGNVEFLATEISTVRIKRRPIGEYEWITLYEKNIVEPQDLNFVFNDYLNIKSEEYEYAWVPVISGVEGNYVTDTIYSDFDGVFITDGETIYKFYAGVEYDTTSQVQKIAVFEPFGRQYPIYVSNAITNYATGGMNGRILGDYMSTGELNREEMVAEKNNLLKFLTNKKAKFIKDWNGNYHLVMVLGNPSVAFDNNWGMGMMKIGLSWSEVGDGTNGDDLYSVGLAPPQ